MRLQKVYIIFLLLSLQAFGASFPKSYYQITDTNELKKRFVSIMLPVIEKENKQILNEREFIKNTIYKSIFNISSLNIKRLIYLKKKYRIARLYDLRSYLRKIDIIPPSLALAQAAIESGWGKSRFVQEANNLFGQWTYSGVGIIPADRVEGATHRIRVFKNLQDSVANYMLNLNMGWAYSDFRKQRYTLRQQDKPLEGYVLAGTLLMYSSTGEVYVDKVRNLIKDNNFSIYD